MLTKLKTRLMAAMKAKDEPAKNILRVIIGEVESRNAVGNTCSDEDVIRLMRKTLVNNQETAKYAGKIK